MCKIAGKLAKVPIMRLDVFGREIELLRRDGKWLVFYCGTEGKKRLAEDISVPPEIAEEELVNYIADICHEWATPNQREVRKI